MVPMAAATLVAIVALSVLDAYLAARRATSLIERQIAEVTRTLAESNFPLTERVLQQMHGLAGAHFVLVDERGLVTSSRGDVDVALLPNSGARDAVDLDFVAAIRVGDQAYYHALLSLPRRGAGAGPQRLHVLYPERAYRAAWQHAVKPPLVIGAASLVAVALIGAVIAYQVSRPLSDLRAHMGHIAEGEFVPVPLPRRNDEIRDLALAVNRMSEMLAKFEQEVRRTEQIRTLGHLVRGLAHQLRNSATGAVIAVDIHRHECPLGQENESMQVAARQLTLIEKFVRKFLSLDARSPRLHAPLNFVELVEGLIPLLRPTAAHVGVTLDVRLPAELLVIKGDWDALEHVVLNLLLNAIEAAERAPGVAPIRDAAVCAEVLRRDSDRVCLVVEDTGPGPSADVAARMFEPFLTDKPHGTGLGLSLARGIVESHGGSIRWERRQTRTCFVVDLPLTEGRVERVETPGR